MPPALRELEYHRRWHVVLSVSYSAVADVLLVCILNTFEHLPSPQNSTARFTKTPMTEAPMAAPQIGDAAALKVQLSEQGTALGYGVRLSVSASPVSAFRPHRVIIGCGS